MRIQDRQEEGEQEENSGQPGGELDQHVRRLRAENIFRHTGAKRRAQTLALGTLHQNDQHHQKRDQHVNREQEVNQDLHPGAANMVANCRMTNWKNYEARMTNDEGSSNGETTKDRIQFLGFRHSFVIGHSSLVIFLYLVPDRVQLGKIDIAQLFTALAEFVFELIKSPHEFVGRSLQRHLGIEIGFPG